MCDWYVGQYVRHTAIPNWRMRILELNEKDEPSILIDVDAVGKITNLQARVVSKLWHITPETPLDKGNESRINKQ